MLRMESRVWYMLGKFSAHISTGCSASDYLWRHITFSGRHYERIYSWTSQKTDLHSGRGHSSNANLLGLICLFTLPPVSQKQAMEYLELRCAAPQLAHVRQGSPVVLCKAQLLKLLKLNLETEWFQECSARSERGIQVQYFVECLKKKVLVSISFST